MIPDSATLPASSPAASTPVPTPPPAERADFDQRLANELTIAATLINAALGSPAVLAELSYSETEIEEGQALQVSAQTAFNARQQAVSTASTKKKERDALLATVSEDFTTYRATVQANLPPSDRVALGAGGRVPTDLQKFITLLRSAYAAAQQAPYAETLAKRKLTAAVLTARIAKVAELETLDGQTKAADKASTAATAARDKAGAALRKWTGDFRKQAKADLRKFPELRAVLGL